jgi:HEAT repeat protein
MEPFLGVLAATLAGSVAYLVAWEKGRSRTLKWQEAVEELGLTEVLVSFTMGIPKKMTAVSGRLRVCVESYRKSDNDRGTRIIVGGLDHDLYLQVRAEGMGSRMDRVFGGREVELGDPAFDQAAYVKGDPALLRALFGPGARRTLTDLFSGRLPGFAAGGDRLPAISTTITESELRVEISNGMRGVSKQLPSVLRALLEVGQVLVRPDDPAERIASNNECEPFAAVRRGNLRVLSAQYPGHAATRRALEQGLRDPSPEVQVEAAAALGRDGEPTLLDIAGRDDVPDELAIRAIAALGEAFPARLAGDTLRRARLAGRRAVVRACLDALARGGAAGCLDDLEALLASGDEDVDLAVASARLLGTVAGDPSERTLIAALQHPAGEVRLEAAGALGKIGTPQAVVPLGDCRGEHRFDAALRAATRQAIAEIQSRVTGASPGQLSLAADDVGQVSLAEPDARGQVSIAREERKQAQ